MSSIKAKKVSDFCMKEITLNPFEENSAQLPSLVFLDSFWWFLTQKIYNLKRSPGFIFRSELLNYHIWKCKSFLESWE